VASKTQTVNLSLLGTLTFSLDVTFEQQLHLGDVVTVQLTNILNLSVAAGSSTNSQFFGYKLGGCMGLTGAPGPTGAPGTPGGIVTSHTFVLAAGC
jgi:hypothetical protein